jgi:hypothetical protein
VLIFAVAFLLSPVSPVAFSLADNAKVPHSLWPGERGAGRKPILTTHVLTGQRSAIKLKSPRKENP